ncbi:MAG: patatin-like phospholipase family protein [Erysipelotrichaceae bacterium]|jgi:predicted acylesterase/phospholipase RssA|nr:patatin-like phospholipase family protein [Erysipelotrichaceae bacterium]
MEIQKVRALVLCGGGALGSYEVGAWKALRELGYHFDIVTGTSIGALNGAFVAIDQFDECLSLWNTVSVDKVMKDGFSLDKNIARYLKHILKMGALRRTLRRFIRLKGADITPFRELCKKHIKVELFKDLKTQFGVVCCSYPSFKERFVLVNALEEKFILPFLHASSACYPVFPKEIIGKRTFVDGGYKNNLPIDFALKLGANDIIAIGLNGIPKVPQRLYLAKLPFVTLVFPHEHLGSFMDFSQETIQRNMILGYNDTMKRFKRYLGHKYTFQPDPLVTKMADIFLMNLSKDNVGLLKELSHLVEIVEKDGKDKVDYLITVMEYFATYAKLPTTPVYKITDMVSEIDNFFEAKRFNFLGKELPAAKRFLSGSLGLVNFVNYFKTCIKTKQPLAPDLVKRINNPYYWIAYSLYLTFDELNLLG